MFMNRNEAEVTIGRSAEFEAMIDELLTIQGQNAAFAGATLLQAYANPGRYMLFGRWTDREGALAAARREQFTKFAEKLRNSGMSRPTRLTESYESVFEVNQDDANPTSSMAERFVDFTLKLPMLAPAFEAEVRELAEVVKQHAPGVISVRLRRSMGNDTKYLMLVITTDRIAARNWLFVPEVRSHTERHSINDYLASSPSGEIHHVVKRYAGPAASAMQSDGVAAAAR